jgi:YD repeat-containing protein
MMNVLCLITTPLPPRAGTKYTFNGFGQIETIEDRNGNKVNVTLNSFGSSDLMIKRVTSVNGPGPELSFTYTDEKGEDTELQNVTIGDRTLTFGYHDVETDVYGSAYEADEVLKSISGLEYVNEFTMGQGRRANRASRVITGSMSKRKVENAEHNFEYESEEDLTTPVAEAKVNKYDIGKEWRNTTITETSARYDNDQSVAHLYAGNKLQSVTISGTGGSATYNYGYNDKGQRKQVSTANGVTALDYDNGASDGVGNLTDITSPGMAAVKLQYGVFGQVSKRTLTGVGGSREFVYELDDKGNTTKTTEMGGVGLSERSWTSPRIGDGSVASVTDPSSVTASYVYGNELGLVQTMTRSQVKLVDRTYDIYGNLLSDKDPNGIGTASILYDKLDRTKTVTHTAGSDSVVSYTYTALDQIATNKVPPAGRSSQGLTTSYSFSAAGKPTGRAEKGTGVNRTYSYSDVDDEGLVKAMTVTEEGESLQTAFDYDYAGRAVSETWVGVTKPRWSRVYDLMGNVTESKDGEENTTAMTYYSDNSLHVLTRPEGRGSVTRTIDGFGNVKSVVDIAIAELFSTPTAITAYEYDAFNRAKQMTDPAGKVWKYTYDLLDNLKTVETPKGDIHTYNYDTKSYLDSYVLPGDKTYDVTAAADGRIQAVKVPKGGSYNNSVDNYNNPLALKSPEGVGDYGSSQSNPYGMPLESLSGGFKTVLDCDDANRVINQAPPYAKGAKKRTVSHGLFGPRALTMMDMKTVTRDPVTSNPLARKVKVGTSRVIETLSDGNGNNVSTTLKKTLSGETADKTVTTEYDCLGFPSRVTNGDESTTYWRDGRGNLQAVFAPSSATFMFYDACDRLTSKNVNGRETEYGYDDNGSCVKIDPTGPVEVNFEYDERDQLKKRIIKIDGNIYRTEVITRDDNGAITARTITGTNNTVVCSESFGRDDNDRLISMGTRTATDKAFLSYSPDSQMTAESWAGTWTAPIGPDGLVTSVAASPAFTFDRDDEGRVTTVKRNGSTAYTYTYDASGLLATETDSTSTLGDSAVITHENDSYGHSMVRSLPADANLTETLSAEGRISSSAFTFGGQTRTVSFAYTSDLLTGITLPGQLAPLSLTYTMAELTGITSGGFSVGLTRDTDTGRVLTKSLGHFGVTDTYGYHGMGRLTGETRSDNSYAAAYGYDEAGKRILRDIPIGDFVHFTPPAASPAGTIYRVGPGFYDTISNALAAVIMDRGDAEFTSPAIIQLEPGTHAEPSVLEAPSLRTTAANQLIIQSRPGTVATLTGQVIVAFAPSNILWRGLVIGGTLSHFSINDVSVSSCIVTGKLFFFYCERASVVGNTFKAPTPAAPLSMMFSMDLLVRDNIFLVDANNGEAIEELEESSADCDYNIYWPSNTLARVEVHGIYTNPCLDTLTFAILSTNSPAFQSGLALPGFGTDFTGALRHPEKPCRGAVELLVNDGSITAGDIRDKGGRLIRRRVQGRIQNLGYDGRNRLNRWDWDGSAGTSCSYDYDHAGRRILTRETVGGATKVTRYVYDGADVCAEYEDSDNDGVPDRTRVYWLLPGMDRRIGFAETVNSTTTFYYYLTDHVGTVLQIVKEDGTVVNQYDYDAFGRVRQASPNTFEGVENRYLFHGREWDKHGGFYYFRRHRGRN